MSLSNDFTKRLDSLSDHYIFANLRDGLRVYLSDTLTVTCLIFFIGLVFLAVFGDALMPYDPGANHRGPDGQLLRAEPPSADHWLGTTSTGQDVFSRLIYGTQPTLVTGLTGGLFIVTVGLTIGVTAGYAGGRVDDILMRATDFIYGIPFIPTAIVLVGYFGMGFWSTVLLIGLLLWRGNARVFRSQVLQIKEREHVRAAKMLGASNFYLVTRHILPNMMGMVVLFFALGTGVTILISAGLAFLGFMDPFVPSWGVMLRNVYESGYMTRAWWWTLPPGIMISFTVLTIIMLGRGYERVNEEKVNQGFGG